MNTDPEIPLPRGAGEDEIRLNQLQQITQNFIWYSPMSSNTQGMVDLCGAVLKVERDLGNWRRGVMRDLGDDKELGADELTGRAYQLAESHSAKRSYHTPAILNAIVEATGLDPFGALLRAISGGALTLNWRWTQLQAFANRLGFELTRGKGKADPENDDLDAPMVMEEWSVSQRILGVGEEGDDAQGA